MTKPNQSTTNIHTDDEEHLIKRMVVEDHSLANIAMQQQALRMAAAMQTTLDIYTLLRKFTKELKQLVPFHALAYKHPNSKHEFSDGQPRAHSIHYNLKVENQILGDLYLSRETPFAHEEVRSIENAVNQLIFPLRNSLAYHEALVSSLTDPLTGLGNRHAYDIAILKEADFCKRHQLDLSLLVLDLDKFKQLNDTYGHLAGDKALQHTAQVFAQTCRDSDIVFRYGGEEFVIILKNCALEGAQNLAQRISQNLETSTLNWHGKIIKISTCIGIAALKPTETPEALFTRADQALYQAKSQGPGHIQMSQSH